MGGELLFFLLLLVAVHAATHTHTHTRHNVVHIIVDDLRHELGCYGLPNRSTPVVDALARRGTLFNRAYAQQAVCGPSRNSFLSGRRPDKSRSWNFINHFREDHPEWTSLPGLFAKDPAYVSLGSGKTWHPKLPPAYDGDRSWTANALPFYNPCWNTADDPHAKFQDGGLPCFFCPIDIEGKLFPKRINVSVGNEFCTVDAYEDTLSVARAVKLLDQVPAGKFFYLALGMHKPHMPWQASKEDFDQHPLESVDLPLHTTPPAGVPPIALRFTDGAVHDSPYQPVSDDTARHARRAYRAAVTGMDRKLGVLIDALDRRGLTNNTAVVLHGDHGWQLGEHGLWRKFTNFELATRVPFVVAAPWLRPYDSDSDNSVPSGVETSSNAPPGSMSNALVELVDLAPTIAALAGLEMPTNETFDGTSLVPLLYATNASNRSVKDAAFSQYPRRVRDPAKAWSGNSIIHHNRTTFTHMGYSMRTLEWRYTEWVPWNGTALRPVWTPLPDLVAAGRVELYDHRDEAPWPTNFNRGENANVAQATEHADTVRRLSAQLRSAFS